MVARDAQRRAGLEPEMTRSVPRLDNPALHDLQIANARWRAVLGTVRDAIVAIDAQSRIALFNPAAEAMFGYRAAEVLGQDVGLLMPAPYRAEHSAYVHRYERTGEARAIGRIRTVQGVRQDGSVFPIELSVSESPVDHQPLYTAILRDVSEQRAIEATLRVERDFAARLIETAPMIVLVIDPRGRIERFNAFLEQLSGHTLDSVRGRDWIETFVVERERVAMRSLCTEWRGATAPPARVCALSTASGAERLVAWRTRPLTDASGAVDTLLCLGEDVTERMRAERDLQDMQRTALERERLADIGAITAKIVHDLGNPLAALSMQAQLILRRARRGDFQPVAPVEGPAEQILRTLRRLEGLVREFTEFARDQQLDLRPIAVAPFLRSCADLWQALAAERGIALSVTDGAPLPKLRADEVMLRRVMDNLIKNAMEAITHPPGAVLLSASVPAAGKVSIVVEDTGAGIAPGLEVFKLFETTKPAGTGIGLAVALQMIAAHGGTIAHSPRAGGGTRFVIELPTAGPTWRTNDGLAAG